MYSVYAKRFYRDWVKRDDLERFQVEVRESDLLILCEKNLDQLAGEALLDVRAEIERYISSDQAFRAALRPHRVRDDAPLVVKKMAEAADFWNVGPMAAVAGAVAQVVGERLVERAGTVIVENGGDIYARSPEPLRLALYAGESSPFSDKVAFDVDARSGIGVCTSSGTVGPSLSFGRADAVVAIAGDAVFADAAATSIANRIEEPSHVEAVVAEEREKGSLKGLIACCGDKLSVWGDLEIARP